MKKKFVKILLIMAVTAYFLGGCGRENREQVTDTLVEEPQFTEKPWLSEEPQFSEESWFSEEPQLSEEEPDIEALKKQFDRNRKYNFAGIDESQLNVDGNAGDDGANTADSLENDMVSDATDNSSENSNAFGSTVHTHHYETITVAVTCTMAGYTEEKCSCGDVRNHQDIPADGHYYEEKWFLAPTCLSGGYVNYVCSKCGNVDESRSGSGTPIPHTVTERIRTEGNCARNKVIEQYCTSCEMVVGIREEAGADIHDWVTYTDEVWDDNAFAMVDKTETYCSRCGKYQ